MDVKISKLPCLGIRREFCYSIRLVHKLLLKTSVCICPGEACVLHVGPIDTLYYDNTSVGPIPKNWEQNKISMSA